METNHMINTCLLPVTFTLSLVIFMKNSSVFQGFFYFTSIISPLYRCITCFNQAALCKITFEFDKFIVPYSRPCDIIYITPQVSNTCIQTSEDLEILIINVIYWIQNIFGSNNWLFIPLSFHPKLWKHFYRNNH